MSRGGEEGGGPFSRAGVSSTGAGRDAVQPEAVRTEGLSRQQEQQDGGQQSGAQPSHASAARGSRRLRTAIRTRARRAIAPLIYTKTQIAAHCRNMAARRLSEGQAATMSGRDAANESVLRQPKVSCDNRRRLCGIAGSFATSELLLRQCRLRQAVVSFGGGFSADDDPSPDLLRQRTAFCDNRLNGSTAPRSPRSS